MIHYFLLSSLAALGALLTYWLIHKKHVSPIRASSGPSLIVAVLFWLQGPHLFPLSVIFFGATFVGMTDHARLGWKRVFLSSQLFVLIYNLIQSLFAGFGGGLGAAAFLSCCLVYEITKRAKKIFILK